jgi:hypothetical protein
VERLDLVDVVRAAIDTRLAAVHVSIPATVVSYDSTRKTATVRPAVKRLVPTATEGVDTLEALPDIPDVRIAWPAGGGSSLVLDLDAGDPVELIISDTDPAGYRSTGEVSPPADARRHSLAHAWAIPGGGSFAASLPTGPCLTLGGSSDAAALASRVAALETAYNLHVHAVTVGGLTTLLGTPFVGTGTSLVPTVLSASGPFGSARIKVDS